MAQVLHSAFAAFRMTVGVEKQHQAKSSPLERTPERSLCEMFGVGFKADLVFKLEVIW
jgi:hypothetical protein